MVLRTRIISVVAIVLILAIGVSTVLALKLQGQRLVSSTVKDIEVLGGVILRSLENSMAMGRTEDVQEMLENIGKNPEIVDLHILSSEGYILKSHIASEVGNHSHITGDLGKIPFDEPTTLVDHNSVTYLMPVRNKAECYGCHSRNIETIGIVEIRYDVSRSMADILSVKRFLITSNILTVIFVTLVLGSMVGKMVMKPLNAFLFAIRSVEAGDLNARLSASSNDEIGQMGKAFNRMLDEVQNIHDRSLKREKEISRVKFELEHKIVLEELNSQLQHKVQEVENANKAVLSLSKELKSKNVELEKMVDRLKSVNEVGRVLTSIIETEELLKLIIRTTAETLTVERGSIYINRPDGSALNMLYRRGYGVEREQDGQIELRPLYRDMLSEGTPVILNADKEGGDRDVSALGVPLKMKGQVVGGIFLEERNGRGPFTPDELELLATMSNQAMVAIENAWLYETVKNNYFGTIQALVNALEASDRYTKGHSERVRYLGIELARYIGLDYRELEAFEHAAILHDIGKIGIDTAVLNKQEELTSKEFSLIRAHPIIGDEILGPIGTLQGVRTTILQHHEKYDGTGYPYGITGDEITLKARVLSVVDTFDAMMTDRPYRKGLGIQYVLDELRQGAGTQFDPTVVNAFLELMDARPQMLEEAGYSLN